MFHPWFVRDAVSGELLLRAGPTVFQQRSACSADACSCLM